MTYINEPDFSYIFQLGTDEVLQSVGATCPKLVYLKFQPRIQVNNTGHYERICVTEKGLLALLNCKDLKTIKVGIKLKYPGTCRRVCTGCQGIQGKTRHLRIHYSRFKSLFQHFYTGREKAGDTCLARIYYCLPSAGDKTSASTLLYKP